MTRRATTYPMALAFAVALGAFAPAAVAYGPFTHYGIARDAAARLGYAGELAKLYIAGALLADVDKSSRLADTMGATAAKLLQGCSARGPLSRSATHTPAGPLVSALQKSADPRVRAFAMGLRNHGVADLYADKTAAARLGRANSGNEDLAFDVVDTRGRDANARGGLAALISSRLLESAELAGWFAAAAGAPLADVRAQMKGYGCFLKRFVLGKAWMTGPLLRAALSASWARECASKAKGLKAKFACLRVGARWDAFVAAHRQIAAEAVKAALEDAGAAR